MSDSQLEAAACRSGRPKGRCSGGVIEIEAPPEIVWSIVEDWAAWGSWNPLYTRTVGVAREGAKVELTVAVPGMKPHDATATIYTVRQNECLEYGLKGVGGMMKAFRFVDIEEITPEKCRVANGEILSGPIGFVLARILGPRVGQGLQAMNAKLKQLAESQWQRQLG